MSQILELKFPSNPRWLKGLREVTAFLCRQQGFNEEHVASITLAVDEACANIIEHAYCGRTDQPIVLSCLANEQQLEIQLRDYGPPVNPARIRPRPLDELRDGGLGTHFIHASMDEVSYEAQQDTGNILRLVKYRSQTQGSK